MEMSTNGHPVARLPVAMWRPHLNQLPDPLPRAGYRLRRYRPGDEAAWAQIEAAAGEFASAAEALQFFREQFCDPAWLRQHLFFIDTEAGEPTATGVAMAGTLCGRRMGRVGWIGTVPWHQGRGLGKWVVAAVLHQLKEEHQEAYLTSQTTSDRAIGIYWRYGFRPCPHGPADGEAWELLGRLLDLPLLLSPTDRQSPPGLPERETSS
jgi:ribosomal protein S18 acetylase RimI-like enzyme